MTRIPPPAADQPYVRPSRCPACQSTAITTIDKTPATESYWRCTRCGEVWNQGRATQGHRYPRGR